MTGFVLQDRICKMGMKLATANNVNTHTLFHTHTHTQNSLSGSNYKRVSLLHAVLSLILHNHFKVIIKLIQQKRASRFLCTSRARADWRERASFNKNKHTWYLTEIAI